MLKHEQLKALKDEAFRRLIGVKRATFCIMIEILKQEKTEPKYRGGRKKKLYIEDELLMALEYIREYRTYFHVATNYGVSESSTYKLMERRHAHYTSKLCFTGKKSAIKAFDELN